MEIIIRADASTSIGTGHVMRCLTIASFFRKQGHHVAFWMEQLPGNLISFVAEAGYAVINHMRDVDILIVDHYQLGREWESTMRVFAKKIIIIDDLANREHDCDLLLDQNVIDNFEHRYDELVPKQCVKLLGPSYLIMREEFLEARRTVRIRDGYVRRIVVFMGGSDPTGETLKVLDALEKYKELPASAANSLNLKHVDIVVGSSNPYCNHIEKRCLDLGLGYHRQINYIARLMAEADFAIGAGGTAMWERCYVGLPSSSTVVADNQLATTSKAKTLDAVIDLGWHEQVNATSYLNLLLSLPQLREQLQLISKQGLYITDSQGRENGWLKEMVGLLDD